MSGFLRLTRDHAIRRTRQRLQRDAFPRLQMALIVALTGGLGFVASFGLLHAGVHGMALRYPLALAVSYLGFLGLLWLCLQASDRRRWRDLPDFVSQPGRSRTPAFQSGGGGDFGGGGASAEFTAPQTSGLDDASLSLPDAELSSLSDATGALGDAEELAAPVLVLLAALVALALALASLWVVWTAPALLSEVLVDGALSFTLYRHLRRSEPRHWLATAVRRTWVPFLITAVFLAVLGGALSAAAPRARSIGEVVRGAGAPR